MQEEIVRSIINEVKAEAFSENHLLKKIQRIVDVLTRSLSVDVCSIYILNRDNNFELYATEGLSKEAVNKTIMEFDEGLVGQIALAKKTLSFENIWNNEHFSYRPETAEDPYYTFIGTPIIAHDNLLGVLVVQNKVANLHKDYHKDVLEIAALLLSRLFLHTIFYSSFSETTLENEIEFNIDFLSHGKADGKVIFHNEYLFKYFGESSMNEYQCVDLIEQKLFTTFNESDKNYFDLFQKQFHWLERVRNYVKNGLLLNVAFLRVFEELSFLLEHNFMQTAFLRKFTDFAMIEGFKLSIQNIRNDKFLSSEDFILVAESINPFMFFYYVNSGVKGFIIENITPFSEIVSIAKSLNIPIITGIDNVRDAFKNGEYIILDSEKSSIRISSSRDFYEKNRNINYIKGSRKNVTSDKLSQLPTINKNINLYAAIGTLSDLELCQSFKNFKGVGMFRQEIFFGNLTYVPNPTAQEKYYKEVFSKIDNENIFVDFFHLNSDLIFNGYRKNQKCCMLGSIIESKTVIHNYLKPLINSLESKKLGLIATANISNDILKFNDIVSLQVVNATSLRIVPSLNMPSVLVDMDLLFNNFDLLALNINALIEYFYSSVLVYDFKKYHMLTLPFLKLLRWIIDSTNLNNKKCVVTSNAGIDDPLLFLVLQYLGFKDIFVSLQFNTEHYQELFSKRDKIFETLEHCFENNVYDVKKAIMEVI